MYVLVVSRELNFRRLIVSNLVIRGYLAVGVASVQEAHRLISNASPRLVIISHLNRVPESDIQGLRQADGLKSVPLMIISAEPPDSGMMEKWDVYDHLLPHDVDQIAMKLSPLLA